MNKDISRLISLIEFSQESAKLKIKPTYHAKKYQFCCFEHELRESPGIHFNNSNEECETWLTIDRLHEIAPPSPEDPQLIQWLEVPNDPSKKPTLRRSIEQQSLEKGHLGTNEDKTQSNKSNSTLLEDLPEKRELESKHQAYIATQWKPWASEEGRRRQTIRIYSSLFKIKRELEGVIEENQLEFVWGIGMCVGRMNGIEVCHPLITQAATISLDRETMALEIGPRDVEDHLESALFASADNPGITNLEKAYKDFTARRAPQNLSPYDPSSFECILQSEAKFLDPKGSYWPEQTSADNRSIPTMTEELKVTDTWVLMARTRSKSFFVHDLERFKKELQGTSPVDLPPALCSVLSILPLVSMDTNLG